MPSHSHSHSHSGRSRLLPFVSFGLFPVTILVTVVYAIIFFVAIDSHESPAPYPPGLVKHDLDLSAAWRDLKVIAEKPHPYNSHHNDVIRDYILSRVSDIANAYPGKVQVISDVHSNTTYVDTYFVYYEGNNILVSVPGSKPDLPAVLFSAHFDSVSTAPGATDAGMGLVSMIHLVEYFAKNKHERTAIFNLNNGEEDWLNGAHAFFEHPLSKQVETFLNLEGAGSGGRPILFRTSNARVARSFRDVDNPHGTSASSDVFKRGLIRSDTDYEVYTHRGLKGLDVAFYRARSRYHTKYDSVPSLNGRASLWAMMDAARVSGNGLLNDLSTAGNEDPAVYFDILGKAILIFERKTFLIINIVLLILGPLIVGGVAYLTTKKEKYVWTGAGWGRTPVAYVTGGVVGGLLAALYTWINPFIVYSSSYPVIISFVAAIYVTIYVVLHTLFYFRPVPYQRVQVNLEHSIIWWIALVVDTKLLHQDDVTGLYIITILYFGSILAVIVSYLELLQTPHPDKPTNGDVEHSGDEVVDASERTPLIASRARAADCIEEHPAAWYWIPEFILSVPFPAMLLSQSILITLTALSQTLSDGSDADLVYYATCFLAFMIVIPLGPYIQKTHVLVPLFLAFVFLGTFIYNLTAFPFSNESPLKVFFQQSINLDTGSNLVYLTGVDGYLQSYDDNIIIELPSAHGQTLDCGHDPKKKELTRCSWEGLFPRVVPQHNLVDATGDVDYSSWLKVEATRHGSNMASFTIRPQNTRNCRIYFDSPVDSLYVKGGNQEVQEGYPVPEGGVKEARLWSRTWDREFELTVGWVNATDAFTGRVACEWAELDGGKIPALDEVLAFLPNWAVVTKASDGLVEGWKSFEI